MGPVRLRRLPRLPKPLLALLAASLILTIAWALLIPPFRAPDEDSHYVYAQSIAEDFSLPPYHSWHSPGAQLSPSVRVAEAFTGGPVAFNDAPPTWDPEADRGYVRSLRRYPPARSPRVDSAADQGRDPPLYHAYAAVAYAATPGNNVFSRLYAMRIWSGLLVLVSVTAAWLLAGELFRGDTTIQLLVAGIVGLQPMTAFISGAVSNDSGAIACCAVWLWLGARLLARGWSRGTVAGFLIAFAAASLSKTVMVALAPAAALVLLIAARRSVERSRHGRGRWGLLAGAMGLVVIAVVGVVASRGTAGLVTAPSKLSRFFSYLWQYYLPALPGQSHFPRLPANAAYSIWLRGSWGAFAQGDVHLPWSVYYLLAAVSLATFAGAAVAVWRRSLRIDPAVGAFFLIAGLGLIFALHVGEYDQVAHGGATITQGRYLLPLLPIAAIAAGLAAHNVAFRSRPVLVGAVLGGEFVVSVLSLSVTASHFYV